MTTFSDLNLEQLRLRALAAIERAEQALASNAERGYIPDGVWHEYETAHKASIDAVRDPEARERLNKLHDGLQVRWGEWKEAYRNATLRRVEAQSTLQPGVSWEETRGFHQPVRTPVPVPKEVPDLRLHLLDRWRDGGPFQRLLPYTPHTPAQPEWERTLLRDASLWWINADMMQLVAAAAPTIPSDVRARDLKLPDGQWPGFVVFETAYEGTDAAFSQVDRVRVHAMGWSFAQVRGEMCMSLSMYHYVQFGDGLSEAEVKVAVESGLASEGYPVQTGPNTWMLKGGAWLYIGRSDWPLDEHLDTFHIEENDVRLTAIRRKSLEEDRRFFASLCVLVNHKLSEGEIVWPARQLTRRAQRHGVTEASSVKYIRLREVRHAIRTLDGEEHERKFVDWSHRWMVRGHMAWRRVGPRKDNRRKLVYVNPHIKGPEDKPLVVKNEVRTWVR